MCYFSGRFFVARRYPESQSQSINLKKRTLDWIHEFTAKHAPAFASSDYLGPVVVSSSGNRSIFDAKNLMVVWKHQAILSRHPSIRAHTPRRSQRRRLSVITAEGTPTPTAKYASLSTLLALNCP